MMARLCASSFDTIFPKINHAYNSLRSYQPIIFHVSPSHIDSLSRPLGFSSLTTSREAYSHVHCLSRWKLWGKQNGMYNVTICRSKQVSKSASACSKIPIGLLNHQVERKIPYHGFTCLSSCTSDKLIQIYRTYSSHATDKLNKLPAADAPTDSSMEGSTTELSDMVGSNWMDIAKSASKTVTDAVMYTGTKAKETSEELMPILQQWVDSSPYLKDTLIPAGWTMVASILAWLVMPRVLRRLHMYAEQGSIALLLGRTPQEEVIYEKSIWGALEDPVRYMITFMAFTQLGLVVAPSTVASQYMPQIWRGAAVLSLVWFLHRWKSNVFARVFAAQKIVGLDRERFLALDKMSSVGLLVLGGMALAEACGVAVQSIRRLIKLRWRCGIQGFSYNMCSTTRDCNYLGLMDFREVTRGGKVEGGVIVNKSRARWRGMVTKVPVRLTDFEKIPQITEDIKGMLKNNPKVFLERESPYCFVSQIGSSYWEITISCNIKPMGKEELLSTEQDILLESARIVRKCGAELGSFL